MNWFRGQPQGIAPTNNSKGQPQVSRATTRDCPYEPDCLLHVGAILYGCPNLLIYKNI